MVIDELIKNYYELHGSFDGILETELRNGVLKKAEEYRGKIRKVEEKSGKQGKTKESSKDWEQACYATLGFSYNNWEPKKLCKELGKAFFTSRANQKVAEEWGIRKSIRKKPLVVGGMTGLDDLVAEYYRNSDDLYCRDGNSITLFKGWLLKNYSRKPESILHSADVAPVLVKAVTKPVSEPVVYQGILYTPFEITEEQMSDINWRALAKVTFKKTPFRELAKLSVLDLLTLSTKDPKLYTKVIAYAEKVGLSYSKVLSWFGLYELDLLKVYQETGFLVYYFDDFCYVYSESGEAWGRIDTTKFMLLVQGKARQLRQEEARGTAVMSGF